MDAASWRYVDHCPARAGQGFSSQARPPQIRGCAPGFVPPMCDSTRTIDTTKQAALNTVDTIEFGPWQPLQPLAIVDGGSGADVSIDDLRVNGESLFTKIKEDSANTSIIAGLGLISNLTFEAIRSGANPFPPSPLIDQNNMLEIDVDGTVAAVVRFFIYLGNPANDGHGVAVGNMQKNGGANYFG
jgi:hypothetical protein